MIAVLRVLPLCLVAGLAAQTMVPVMPAPARGFRARAEFVVDSSFNITLAGERDPLIDRAVARWVRRLGAKTGIALSPELVSNTPTVRFRIQAKAAPEDESYTLAVAPRRVELRAAGPLGVLRGLATFFQLVSVTPSGASAPMVTIDDRPRFVWRGLMIDVARHFVPVDVLLRQIDGMELVKMNVLHLHLSDNEGFRVESKVFPKLQDTGSEGQFYSQDNICKIVEYARERGVRVVPEFDVPGHSRSWLAGYPELGSGGILDANRDAVYDFLDRLFGEMSGLFPDRYFHAGGDEVPGDRQLQARFSAQVRELLHKHGKTMIGWDEVLGGDVPADVAVEAWRSSRMIGRSAAGGHPTIVAAGYYLDWLMPAWFHYAIDPLDTAAYGAAASDLDRVKGTPLAAYLSEDNVATGAAKLTAAEEQRVLGGEAALWTELVTPEMLDGRIWPRAAAIAERLWSPKTVRDADSMYERLARVSHDLEVVGLRHRVNEKAMLERIAPGANGTVLLFAETLEPVKFYARMGQRVQGRAADPPGLADALPPESLAAAEFRREVRRLLARRFATPEAFQDVRAHVWAKLSGWRDAADSLRGTMPYCDDVKSLSEAGLDALKFWEQRQAPPADWIAKQRELIAKHTAAAARSGSAIVSVLDPQPASETLIAIVPAIEDLVNACAKSGPGLKAALHAKVRQEKLQ